MATKLAFTTLREDQGQPLFWSAHWQRLCRSWQHFASGELAGEKHLYAQLRDHWQKNPATIVRIDLLDNGEFELSARALQCLDDEAQLNLCISEVRLSPRPYPSWLKCGDYSDRFKIRDQARLGKFDDVLYLDENNFVCESTVSNIIWLKENKFLVPKANASFLQGISSTLLQQRYPKLFESGDYNLKELLSSDAAWLINAVTGPQRIAKIDNTHFPRAVPQLDLDQLYWELVKSDRENRA